MANNRIYLRCKQCGEVLYLGKHSCAPYHWEDYSYKGYPVHLEDNLNDFFEKHYYCTGTREENNECDTPYSDDFGWDTNFEIAYEFDNITKQDYCDEYRKEMENYGKQKQNDERRD